MPAFGKRSARNLAECHPDVQRVFNEVIKHYDCTVLDGARDIEEQRENVRRGVSKTMNSKHLPVEHDGIMVSLAADVCPYPINWKDERRMLQFSGFVLGTATQMGIKLRWGGDWDGDTDLNDQTFNDLVHFGLLV